jgi:hypothetical protein
MDNDECGVIDGMIGRGNRSTRRKPAPVPVCPKNWVTLFLGEINTGTWHSNLGESQK